MTLDSNGGGDDPHPPHATLGPGFTTRGLWFGPARHPVAGWWTTPAQASRDGVVIAAPLGYEYWSTHRSLRTLAEALARTGWNVLRFDWDGTGDSAGEATDPDRVVAWRTSLAHAIAAMRDAGVERVVLVGLRLGATLALLDAAALGADAVVACAPVPGKRFIKELKLLGITYPEDPDTLVYSGLVVNPDSAATLAQISNVTNAPAPVSRTLVVVRSASEGSKIVASLRADQRHVDTHECPEMQMMLDVAAGDAKVPAAFIDGIVAWLGPARHGIDPVPTPSATVVDMPWRGNHVHASFLQVDGLTALRCAPAEGDSETVVVFLNSGAEPHIGPARAWVEYARELATHGYTCLRTDFSGWGESPDEGHQPGRPYDDHCVADTQRIVASLRKRYKRVVLAGLCAGAWVALKAAQQIHVDGVFALNPQLYWQPGLPIIIRISDVYAWRTPMRERHRKLARWKLWSLLDLFGARPMASRWLTVLCKRRTPVMLSFAEGDDGLTYLRDRCGRRLALAQRAGYLTVEEIPGIDHQNYRLWHRPAVVTQLLRFLHDLPPVATACD